MATEEKLTDEDRDRLHFMTLVQTYQHMAWMALGKLANPVTQKVERELDQARWAIDMLAMLERRTKGNLNREESRSLGQILYTLRMNYVDEASRPPEQGGRPPEREAKPEEARAAEPSAEAAAQAKPAEGEGERGEGGVDSAQQETPPEGPEAAEQETPAEGEAKPKVTRKKKGKAA